MIQNGSVWPTPFPMNAFTALKGTHFCIFIISCVKGNFCVSDNGEVSNEVILSW